MDMQVKRIDNVIYGPQVDISVDGRGLGRLIFDKMLEYKDKVLQIDAQVNEEQTYGDIHKKLVRIALEMKRRGVKENDFIVICAGNNKHSLLPVYSTLYLNAITGALDPSLALRNVVHLLNIVPPKLIFVTEDGVDLIEKASAQLENKPEIVVVGFLRPHPDEDNFVPDNVKDIHGTSNIFFSSGTTGLPKAVMHSHYSMLKSCLALRLGFPCTGTFLYYTSFYWISSFLFNTTLILCEGNRLFVETFTPDTFLKYVERYKVRLTFLSSTYAIQFSEEMTKKFNTNSLEEMMVGGSIINENHILNLRKYFPHTAIRIGYGQTEVGGVVTVFTKYNNELSTSRPGSCGVPFLNIKLKISDLDTGKTRGPNQKGEVRLIADTVFRGYLTSSTNTVESSFDHEGYLKTGDIAYYDEDNCLFFCDRIKEMFKYRSWHVVPASVESIIYDHPAVLETVVIGVPHELDDHHPMALVVLREGHTTTEEELLDFVNEKVTDRERLRAGLRIVRTLPKTPSGKLARPEIKDYAISGNLKPLMVHQDIESS